MNKNGLAIVLLISMVLVLYSPVTALIDLQNVMDDYYSISSALLKARDDAILQILGFVFLYIFLGAVLYYYDLPSNQQYKPTRSIDNGNQPTQQARQTVSSGQINPQWSFCAGFLVALAVFLWQLSSAIERNLVNQTGVDFVGPIVYAIIAGCVVGTSFYLLTKSRTAEI